MHFHFTGPAVVFMRSPKVAPQESLSEDSLNLSRFKNCWKQQQIESNKK